MNRIQVNLNDPRVEIEKPGFRIFRYGRSLQLAEVMKTLDIKGGKSGIDAWGDSDSRDFIRNPGTGAIQVRPSGMRDDFFESTAFTLGKFEDSDWNYSGDNWEFIDFAGYANQGGS